MTTAHTRSYAQPSFGLLPNIDPVYVLAVGLLACSVVWIFQLVKPSERIDAAMKIIPVFVAVGAVSKKAIDETNGNRENKEKLKTARSNEATSEIASKLRITSEGFFPAVNAGTPELDERISFFNERLKKYVDRIVVFQKLADYLEREETQPRLIKLAKEAKDFALQNTNKLHLLTTGLLSVNVQDNFHRDIYENLRVWLTVSIRFDVVLPAQERVIKDRTLYVKALTFLRDHRVESFLDPDEFYENRLDFYSVLKDYLTYLIEAIEADPT